MGHLEPDGTDNCRSFDCRLGTRQSGASDQQAMEVEIEERETLHIRVFRYILTSARSCCEPIVSRLYPHRDYFVSLLHYPLECERLSYRIIH